MPPVPHQESGATFHCREHRHVPGGRKTMGECMIAIIDPLRDDINGIYEAIKELVLL